MWQGRVLPMHEFEVNSEEGLDLVDEFYTDSESVEGQQIVGV